MKILVVGDVILDTYIHGTAKRISPEAPIPVVEYSKTRHRLGGAANVASNLCSLGAEVGLIYTAAADEPGKRIRRLLQEKNIQLFENTSTDTPSIEKQRIIVANQQLLRIDREIKKDHSHKTFSSLQMVIQDFDAVVFSDYDKGVLGIQAMMKMLKLAKDANKPVFIDPKNLPIEHYQGATLFKPNRLEIENYLGTWQSEEEFERLCSDFQLKYNFDYLLVTLGEKGMKLFRKGCAAFALPALQKEVYDVTGAGDTVIAVLAYSMSVGHGILEAMRRANAAAAVAVNCVGTLEISNQAIDEQLAAQQAQSSTTRSAKQPAQIVSLEELIEECKRLKQKGKKLVFTNGCFDILHSGHMTYLHQASQLGDVLIVAINSDESVRGLKGQARPILKLAERLKNVSHLVGVDFVVSFSDATPYQLITQLLPDVLVKGGDYRKEQVVGADIVEQNNGKVAILDFVPGVSTSTTLEKIQAKKVF